MARGSRVPFRAPGSVRPQDDPGVLYYKGIYHHGPRMGRPHVLDVSQPCWCDPCKSEDEWGIYIFHRPPLN
jgi:hypothetical protein